jgi:DNA-binding NtrC family response regulator
VSDDRTVPSQRVQVPVGTLRVDVVHGPDAGVTKVAKRETITAGTAAGNDLVLTDPTVSRFHLELIRERGGVRLIDHGSTNGTFVDRTRIERATVSAGTELVLGNTRLRVVEGDPVQVELRDSATLGRLRGRTPVMRRLMAQIERVAESDVGVLLVGESGTGKELIAEAIHELSARTGPLLTVDCAAMSPTLVASELFGHERGAFTGADQEHEGAFERASGGTIFLDEIGEIPAALQATLLGVLERRRFRRVGGKEERHTDVRVVCATNRDLRAEVNDGSFRLDLYYRIAVVTLAIPPLRERPDDIPLLFEHFVREAGHTAPLSSLVSKATLDQLKKHRFPGNVRELRNLVEATLAMGAPPSLDGVNAPDDTPSPAARPNADLVDRVLELPYKDARRALLEEFEGRYLSHLMDRVEGNVSKASREAKMDRSYLLDLLRRHKLR